MNKLLATGIAIMSAGTVGIIFAVVMELNTNEPIYLVMVKIAAGFFGVGGPLLGWGIARRARRRH